jgi:CubicO group peptidase (beta-lactamase class C family)
MEGTAEALPRTVAALERGVADGLHVGAQVYVSRHGAVVGDFGIGLARPGVPMRPDTVMLWLSCTKPVAAVAAAQLWERGLLDLDDRISRHIPEFGTKGKAAITVRHILTHTAGFRGLLGNWEDRPWDQVIAAVCDARLEPGWMPGRTAGYHVATSWYVLGELVRRLDGRPFERYVREAIFEPVGMRDSWVGMPPARYREYGERIGWMHRTDGAEPRADNYLDTEAGIAQCRPGSNGHGPARELGRFYEMLLNHGTTPRLPPLPPGESRGEGEGRSAVEGENLANQSPPTSALTLTLSRGEWRQSGAAIVSPQTVEAITAPHRVGLFDETFKHTMDWALGFIVNSARYGPDTVPYGFGPHASDRAFGHGGAQSSVAFADPEHGLAAAVICNGTPGEAKHQRRIRQVLASVYEDLGLAP